ncbi:ATP-dependent RNA helicase glh-2-like [Saccostrea echinata]|uniref:ATP-dependent RNA helicase glh-2-like n=1 Tax=Saccostrea echinata TaxID=191078 RepID=UPI002A81E841|nr:ATP-dependent RNA helicase glh-2-like [Saccostrea echinata]
MIQVLIVLLGVGLTRGQFWPGGFNPFRMLDGDFGPFDPHGIMQRMRKTDLNNFPPGTKKVFKDRNGEGAFFTSPNGNSGGFVFSSGGGRGFALGSGFDGRAPDTGFVMTSGTGSRPHIYEFGPGPKGERRFFKDGNTQGTFFRSADGNSEGFTFTSGNGRGFAMGGSSTGVGPEGAIGGASFTGGSAGVGAGTPEAGSFAFSGSSAGSIPKKKTKKV